MRPYILGLAALVSWVGTELPASAAWNNVFQPTLFGRLRRPVTTNYYYAPPVVANYSPPVVASYSPPVVANYSSPVVAASPAPCATGNCGQQCTTQYVQRSYYQPVTTYRTETAYEPVTTYRTSYYQEPVTSYRYSCYYDPCSCSYQQVATPVTSYQLREQKCPVQSWVARCYQVPVTTQQLKSYWEPQTTCCSTTVGSPIFPTGAVAPQVPTAPPVTSRPPVIDAAPSAPTAPSISSDARQQSPSPPMYERYYPPITPNSIQTPPASPPPPMPPVSTSPRQAPLPQPPVRLEGIAFGPDSRVEGQVVRNDQTPRANAKVMFVNSQTGSRQTINANSAGRFNVELTGGAWLVYLYGADDLPTLADRFEVFGRQSAPLRLVSR